MDVFQNTNNNICFIFVYCFYTSFLKFIVIIIECYIKVFSENKFYSLFYVETTAAFSCGSIGFIEGLVVRGSSG